MRILADENVAATVVRALRLDGHDVNWIAEFAQGSVDEIVLAMAVRENRLLLTHDKEFAVTTARRAVRGLQGIILLRLDRLGPEKLGVSSPEHWRRAPTGPGGLQSSNPKSFA